MSEPELLKPPITHRAYRLDEPPARATCFAHAETITRYAFGIAPRTIEGWPIDQTVINGRRQPPTAETWAMALADLPEPDRELVLTRMAPDLRQAVTDLLPSALDFFAAKTGRGRKSRLTKSA